MRFITGALIFCSMGFSANTFAAPTPGETFAKSVASAESWTKLIAGMKASLNPLVAKELTALTQDLPFPTMHIRKGSLIISNENGQHMNVMFFKKDGAVTMNGKEFVLRPLSTSAAEVERISAILEARMSMNFLEAVIPSANAAGLGMATSVAAAAYASSISWKGQACSQEDISKELIASCSLMAVAMESGTNEDEAMRAKLLPVTLKCPASNGGEMEIILKNARGLSNRFIIPFPPSRRKTVVMSKAEKGSPFTEIFQADPNEAIDPETKNLANKIRLKGDALFTSVCQADEGAQARYQDMLAANSKTVLSKASINESGSGSEKKTSSGL